MVADHHWLLLSAAGLDGSLQSATVPSLCDSKAECLGAATVNRENLSEAQRVVGLLCLHYTRDEGLALALRVAGAAANEAQSWNGSLALGCRGAQLVGDRVLDWTSADGRLQRRCPMAATGSVETASCHDVALHVAGDSDGRSAQSVL